ncbi:MAG: IclR family transcriptional regulator C-terminal domain-containing protein, partial [Candidimonas sp.]
REAGDEAVVTSISALQPSPKAMAALLRDVRQAGMAQAHGNPLPGIDAVSVPVFDHSGNIALALTSLGPSTLFDASPRGPIATALKNCAQRISANLGFRPEAA